MVITDFDGKLIEGKYKAPSEVNMHARAYKARSDIQSVAHLAQPYGGDALDGR